MTTALYIGRFQPLHDGHMFSIENAIQRYGELIIVIESAQECYTRMNPLTAGERYVMLKDALDARGFKADIIPVDDTGSPLTWVAKIESTVPKFDIVVTGAKTVARLFMRRGYKIDFLLHHPGVLPSGEYIRQNIAENKVTWKDMVPANVRDFMVDGVVLARIRECEVS